MESGFNGDDAREKLKGIQITSLDDEDDNNDYDSEEEEEEEQEPVTLGLLETPEHPRSLLRQFYPCKAGGCPAWLDPINMPSGRSCVCDICGNPLQFLLQVYAPISDKESTFHRTLFVFMCPMMSCLRRDQHEQRKKGDEKPSQSVKVFRCQLPHLNPFYSSEPRSNGTDEPSKPGVALCDWCGTFFDKGYYIKPQEVSKHYNHHEIGCQQLSLSQIPGSSSNNGKTTSTERNKVYGALHHMLMEDMLVDLLKPIERSTCLMRMNRSVYTRLQHPRARIHLLIWCSHALASNELWPKYEIRIEDENEFDSDMSDDNEHDNQLVSKKSSDGVMESLLDCFKADSDKKCWASFLVRIAKAPGQVLRYCRNDSARPLWSTSSGRPSKQDIPKCNYCGSRMIFEFQILPQLLYYFGVKNESDSLDWANIIIYTCRASCEYGSSNTAYKQEFAWVQLMH
ncbi:uncharacterized protein LOC126687221 [Mercurialis annua]|uniref:uncharacterized protein LOC126687221 n=1 Tax=Mercurialis annua TaxID=3986 RepID=UPI0024AE8325|nr:uncharacterized protein LOC126687221 [Mercurialis annua]